MMFLLVSILVLSFLLALIPHVLYVVACLCAWPWHAHVAYRPFGVVALALVAACVVMVLYGHIWGRFRYEVKSLDYVHRSIPEAFNNYKIVHISDLHLDSWNGHADDLEKRVEAINALKPDLICFTGDLVSMSAQEAEPYTQILKRLHAKDGIVSVLGNHDYFPYARNLDARQKKMELQKLISHETHSLGWRLLLNEHIVISRTDEQGHADSIAIIGTENQSVGAHSVVKKGNLKKAMAGIDPTSTFSILLTHDPSHWRKEVLPQTTIPLTLSGHTHAMQFRLLGITPSRFLYPECDGLYEENGRSLYVNIGLGGTLPFRIGATPEITLVTLKRAQQ